MNTYLPTELNLVCLGPDAAFVKGEHRSLYEKLGCRSTPRSEDIVEYIERLQDNGEKPEDSKILYATLVQSLRLEGEPDGFVRIRSNSMGRRRFSSTE